MNWRSFRRDDQAAYQELRGNLIAIQHGLCGYCEISLRSDSGICDTQVEHIIPQSESEHGKAQALNYDNLIASCRGGTEWSLFGANTHTPDPERYLPPQSDSTSCGQAKRDAYPADFVDPRLLPAFPALFRVNSEGVIEEDENAGAVSGIAVCRVKATAALLGLNVARLQRARRSQWEGLTDALARCIGVPGATERLARQMLLPDSDGNLHKFFTTSRSRLGALGERILEEPPQAWI